MAIEGHSRVVLIGNKRVAFPDRMSDAEIAVAVRNLRTQENAESKVVLRLLNGGARLADDAERVMQTFTADQAESFRDAFRAAINDKAAGDPIKARKIFLAVGDTARKVFGNSYAQMRREFDRASKGTK